MGLKEKEGSGMKNGDEGVYIFFMSDDYMKSIFFELYSFLILMETVGKVFLK